MTYDAWKSTNPNDGFLGPEPQYVEDDPTPESDVAAEYRDIVTLGELLTAIDGINMELRLLNVSPRIVYCSPLSIALIEKTLTDGSKVYDLSVRLRP